MKTSTAVIIGVSILAAAAIGVFVPNPFDSRASIDSGARIDIQRLRFEVEELSELLEQYRQALEASGPQGEMTYSDQSMAIDPLGPNAILDAYAQVVLIANRRKVNAPLEVPSRQFLVDNLGAPRQELSDECQPMTNESLSEHLVLEQVGPIRVRMLAPAIESLSEIFERIRAVDQDLYDRINTAGSLCVRRIRGSINTLSSHAFGLALDINIDGALDTLGDGRTQLGLTIIADFFKDAGWIWGAAFSREDSMHFEVGQELLRTWIDEGRL